jgi:hypothetical protein
MGNADGVFDVDTEGDSVAGVGFELADLLDGFEYVAAHVFFHQQQNHVALGFQAQAEKGLVLATWIPSPRALEITVEPVAPFSLAASTTLLVIESSVSAMISLKCILISH